MKKIICIFWILLLLLTACNDADISIKATPDPSEGDKNISYELSLLSNDSQRVNLTELHQEEREIKLNLQLIYRGDDPSKVRIFMIGDRMLQKFAVGENNTAFWYDLTLQNEKAEKIPIALTPETVKTKIHYYHFIMVDNIKDDQVTQNNRLYLKNSVLASISYQVKCGERCKYVTKKSDHGTLIDLPSYLEKRSLSELTIIGYENKDSDDILALKNNIKAPDGNTEILLRSFCTGECTVFLFIDGEPCYLENGWSVDFFGKERKYFETRIPSSILPNRTGTTAFAVFICDEEEEEIVKITNKIIFHK
ncbi:MAG: hypothetical protein ACLSVG_02510 [Clostridia bacterium]